MRRVERSDIADNASYARERDGWRARVLAVKARRRVHLGEHLTFLFENFETLRYQVQEMLRIEGRSSEADIAHEIATYNELLGEAGDLGCTLLIEIADVAERDRKLRAWRALPEHLFVVLKDGREVRASYDARQVGDERLSSVQYLRFAVAGQAPIAIACDLEGLELRVDLTQDQRVALAEDLAS